jgi:esterase
MKLHFKKQGQGRPIIILHGLFGMLDNWQSVANVLAEKYEVWLVDQRNHGHSPHSNEFNYDVMAADLHEFIQDHHLHLPVVIGHSMGGKTAMRHAQLFPQDPSKLVIVDMGIKQYPVHHDLIIEALNQVDTNSIQSRKEAEEILIPKIPDFGTRQFLLKNLHWSEDKKLIWRFNLPVLAREIDRVVEALPTTKVSVPALFISGEKSNYVTEEDHASILEVFPNSVFSSVANAGHWVHAEAPQTVIELVNDFVEH